MGIPAGRPISYRVACLTQAFGLVALVLVSTLDARALDNPVLGFVLLRAFPLLGLAQAFIVPWLIADITRGRVTRRSSIALCFAGTFYLCYICLGLYFCTQNIQCHVF